MVTHKEKYEELVKRIKNTTKYFDTTKKKYYRRLYANEFPKFFSRTEVLRSKI